MSTTGLKLGSLVIRTLAKPIATQIRAQAREHPRFRRLCINIAQRIHRVDMRLRLGILRDAAAIEKADQAEREWYKKEATKRLKGRDAKYPSSTSTVSSSFLAPSHPATHHVTGAEVAAAMTEKELSKKPPRIRPLSESKAIENGANFISEFFLFSVAGGLILLEQIRSRRKEASRRDMIADRLEELEEGSVVEVERLRRLEERSREDEERILRLEEENWRLKGGKGVFSGRRISEDRRAAEEKMILGKPAVARVKVGGFWSRIWASGRGNVEDETRNPENNVLEVSAKQSATKDASARDEKPNAVPLDQSTATAMAKK